MEQTTTKQNVEANNEKNSFEFGTIGYWKERIERATDLTIVGVSKSTNRNWDAGIYNYYKIFVVIDGKLEEMRFTENETKTNLSRLPIKKKDGEYMFYSHVLGMSRPFSILHTLGIKLFNDGYYLNKFQSSRGTF